MAVAQPTWPRLAAEAEDLVEAAAAAEITLRVVGATGIHLHCEAAAAAIEEAKRPCKDIDFVVRGGDRQRIRELLEARGYEIDRDVLVASEGTRLTFTDPVRGICLDVFIDKMEFSHTIDLSRRLDVPGRTVPVEDLLLQKLQVHDFTRNDLLDATVLLATHPVGVDPDDPERIDSGYVARLLARDWGFHHTVLENLTRVEAGLEEGAQAGISAATVGERIAELRAAIEAEPKSRGWRMRARVGERLQWWNDVDDPHEVY